MLQLLEHDLTSLNTLGLKSRAAHVAVFTDPGQLEGLSSEAARHARVFVLGGGSNVVLGPFIEGLIIKVESQGMRLLEETHKDRIVEAQAGQVWHDFVAQCLARGWTGLENLALIPGTVGAAPVQNIGAYGLELDQRFHSLLAWDLHKASMLEMGPADCGFSYRNSFFKQAEPGRWLIVAVRFRLPREWTPLISYPDLQRHPSLHGGKGCLSADQVFEAVCEVRRRKLPDPAVLGNAGSFFKNPVVDVADYERVRSQYPDVVAYPQENGRSFKLAAGWLIDHAGWKGRRMGVVGVHDRQALVLVNYGGAQARDIIMLAEAIRDDVAARFGVLLEQEPVPVN